MDLDMEFQKTQNNNQNPQDLGLKFEKTNIEIRNNIFEIRCVYMCVCQFSGKRSSPNLPKNVFTVGNSQNKNQNRQDTMYANFQLNGQLWLFGPKFSQKQI